MPSPRRKSPQELEQELEKIYTDGDGQLPDFTRLEGKPRSRFVSFLFGALIFFAFAAVVSWTGFFFFLKPSPFTGDRMVLSFEGPEHLTAGAETEITVKYANNERVPVAAASLVLTPPKEFTVLASEPPQRESGGWLLGSIAPGAEGSVKVRGWSRAEVGATVTFQAALDYKPADFSSAFQKAASHSLPVGDSVLTLSATGPDENTPGDRVDFVFTYANASDRELKDMRFVLEPLDGFVVESSEPEPVIDVGWWKIPDLAPNGSGTIVVRGTFSSAARGPKILKGRIGFVADDAFSPVAASEARTEVLKSDLGMQLIVNGSDKPPSVSFGDTLHFSLVYRNAGDVPLRDVSLVAELPSEPEGVSLVDWVTLKDAAEGVRKDATVTWTKKQIEGLAELKPGDEGTIDFSVQLTKKPEAKTDATRYAVNASVRGKIGKAGKAPGREVTSDPLAIVFNSDAAFRAFGRYFDESGAPLGQGELPPKVGAKTVYRIVWIVQNSLHELTNLGISTVLPQGVRWTAEKRQVVAGDLTADDTGRKITWRLNRMPTSVTSLTVSFDVELSPTAEDVGNILPLTGENRFEAFDKETQTVILKTLPAVGTDLLGDEHAGGKGVVRE